MGPTPALIMPTIISLGEQFAITKGILLDSEKTLVGQVLSLYFYGKIPSPSLVQLIDGAVHGYGYLKEVNNCNKIEI